MAEPIPVRVTRYRCPHCVRSHSSRSGAVRHIARCWFNPDARGCKTCAHFEPADDACGCTPGCNWGNSGQSIPEGCAVGVDLTGRPACPDCKGVGSTVDAGSLGVSECVTCGGDAVEVKPGPIVGCPLWEAAPC